MKNSILVINGSNLNLLGTREPEIYGSFTLNEIEELCRSEAESHQFELSFKQSNHEGELIEFIQKASGKHQGIIINPGGYSHTSISIMDALKASKLPIIEVHLSNLFKRESFRQHSYVSLVANGVIYGLGVIGYKAAVKAMVEIIKQHGDGSK